MISEDLKKMLASLGVSAEELKDAALYRAQAWLDDQKTSLDTETRRKCRMFWGAVCIVSSALCCICLLYTSLSESNFMEKINNG